MSEELTAWVEETASRAVAYATSLVGNRSVAEELVQDCYLRLLQKRDRYNLRSDGTKLLFKSVTNACINWTQRRPPEVSLETDSPAGGDQPAESAMCDELSEAIDRALADLPVDQRAIVELSAWGHSSQELAEIMQVTAGHARVLLHRARETLTQKLKPYLEEDHP